jgi:hypothetical protein
MSLRAERNPVVQRHRLYSKSFGFADDLPAEKNGEISAKLNRLYNGSHIEGKSRNAEKDHAVRQSRRMKSKKYIPCQLRQRIYFGLDDYHTEKKFCDSSDGREDKNRSLIHTDANCPCL